MKVSLCIFRDKPDGPSSGRSIINYFGETLLYIGLTMLTCVWWLGFLPLLMFLSFIFFHIPALDAYLLERYGDEFEQYAASTKKYVPFVY